MLGLNVQYLIDRDSNLISPWPTSQKKLAGMNILQLYRPDYAAFQYANRHLTENSKVLGLYIGGRGYYSDIDISFDLKILQQFAAKAISATDIVENCKNRQFTHLLVNYALFNYWVQKFDLHERTVLKEFFEKCVATEFSKEGYRLLRLIRFQ